MSVRFSVLLDWLSLHAALLFLLYFQLVRSRFGASNAFLAIRLPVSRFFFFFSLPIFVFGSFHLWDAIFFTCLCVPFVFGSFCLAFQWSSFSFISFLYSSVLLPMFRLLAFV